MSFESAIKVDYVYLIVVADAVAAPSLLDGCLRELFRYL
jgi:hypothetical protein